MEAGKTDTFKTTGELLDLATSIHQKLKRHYERQKSSLADSDGKMLLDYIRQNEKHVTAMISRYCRQAPDGVLDAYYQFTPDELKILDEAVAWQPDETTSAPEVLAVALEFDDHMHAFYQRASEMAPSQPVREMFDSLAEAMAAKKRDEAMNATQIQDI